MYDKIAALMRSGVQAPRYALAGSPDPPNGINAYPEVRDAIRKLVPDYMRCPSSPIPVTRLRSIRRRTHRSVAANERS